MDFKLLALFAFFAISLILSLTSGNSFLLYSSVSRDKQPTGYWAAIVILGVFALAMGAFAVWPMFGHPRP